MENNEKKILNPWGNLWIHPKLALRSILDTDPKRWIHWIAVIWGVLTGVSQFAWIHASEKPFFQAAYVIIGMLILGIVAGFVNLYVGGWLYQLVGSWLGGKGTFTQLRAAMGWSLYPFGVATVLSILTAFSVPSPWIMPSFGFLSTVATVWALVILFNTIGEAHQFSAWKGLLTVLIGIVLILLVVLVVSFFVTPFSLFFR